MTICFFFPQALELLIKMEEKYGAFDPGQLEIIGPNDVLAAVQEIGREKVDAAAARLRELRINPVALFGLVSFLTIGSLFAHMSEPGVKEVLAQAPSHSLGEIASTWAKLVFESAAHLPQDTHERGRLATLVVAPLTTVFSSFFAGISSGFVVEKRHNPNP